MDKEEQLQKKFAEYQKLGESNKEIDVASLMLNELSDQKKNLVSARAKKWAYLVCVALPPLGLLFALKFYLGTEDDAKQTALICVILTIVSILLFWITLKIFFTGSGVDLNELQQMNHL